MTNAWLTKNAGTQWQGKSELWLDPLGNEPSYCDCSLVVAPTGFQYTWAFEGKPQQGSLTLHEDCAFWGDSWHQSQQQRCDYVPDAWGLVTVCYCYQAPNTPDWAWRIKLSQRPDDTLVLQMTNIAPWGEEARAVRMVFSKNSTD